MKTQLMRRAALLSVLSTISAGAGNLLTHNPDFNSGFPTYFDGAFTMDNANIAGWRVVLGGSYAGVGDDQGGIGQPFFAYCGSAVSYDTSSGSRAAVVAGTSYNLACSLRNDANNTNGADVYIDWYSNNNSYDGAGLIGTTSLGNPLANTSATGAFLDFTPAAVVAPPGATYAAVRYTTVATGGAVIADNFVLDSQPIRLNLFKSNPSFDDDRITYIENSTVSTDNRNEWDGDIIGWKVTTATPGYVGVANDQNGIGSPNFNYTVGNSVVETDSDVRAAVVAGQSYTVSFATRTSGNSNGAEFFIDWYDNNTDFTGLISTSNLGNPVAGGTPPAGGTPLTVFTQDLIAPTGATHAAFRFSTAGTSGDVLTNDFSIQNALPTAGFELLNFTINVGNQQATLTWESVSGIQYRIVSSINLSDWSNVLEDNILGNAVSTTRTVSFTGGEKRFFRVEKKP